MFTYFIIIIIYIYHVLINALSAHMIHINLNMTFYTHVKHSPTKTIYIKYYTHTKNPARQQQQQTHYTHTPPPPPPPPTHTHTDCSRNWVLILFRTENLVSVVSCRFTSVKFRQRSFQCAQFRSCVRVEVAVLGCPS